MSKHKRWQERYQNGNTPWDLGRADSNLISMVLERPIKPYKALEIGCGMGANAIWLAQHNFTVTAIDISEIAVQKAKKKAHEAGIKCDLFVADFLKEKIPNLPFEFVFDRGCFHSFDSEEERNQFADNVAQHLDKNGLWLSLIGNSDDAPRDGGPPQLKAIEIVKATEPFFEILSLTSTYFESNRQPAPRAWSCLMRKRKMKPQGVIL